MREREKRARQRQGERKEIVRRKKGGDIKRYRQSGKQREGESERVRYIEITERMIERGKEGER